MYLKLDNGFADQDLILLTWHLDCFDAALASLTKQISSSRDPDAEGLLDKGEYIIGAGFAAIQRYMSSTYPQLNISKSSAFSVPPYIANDITFANTINAGANYWKHLDEWGLRNIVSRDVSALSDAARGTILTIERITPWEDYTCSNLLEKLLGTSQLSMSSLLSRVTEWRNNLDEEYSEKR